MREGWALSVKFSITHNRTLLAAIFGAVLAAGTGLVLHTFRVGSGLVRISYDWLLVARGDVTAKEAVVIHMDEESYERLRQPKNAPWDRALHARLLDRLTAAGAKSVVFDIVFSDPLTNSPGTDERFAKAIKDNGRVILAADNRAIGPKAKKVTPPIGPLVDAAAGFGAAEVTPGPDMVVREHTTRDEFDLISTLSWAAAEFEKAPVTQREGQEMVHRWVNHYGRPGSTPSISYYEALDSALAPDELFRGKAVFVGARMMTKFAGERKDEYSSPFTYWLPGDTGSSQGGLFLSGVELQATMYLNLVRGDWLSRGPRWAEQLLIVALGLLFGFGLVRFRPLQATSVGVVGLTAVAGVAYFVFRQKLIWGPWLIVVVQIAAAHAWSVLFNSVQFYVQKRLMENTLSMYLSPKLVKKFARDPRLLQPGAEKQTITIVFTDIENFTSLSQGMDSDELAEFMNRYFHNIVTDCIHAADGTVVKYIGDAVFAFWNAPEAQEDHALRACEAALHVRGMEPMKMRGTPVRTRLGIHTGEANVGNFGSFERVDYTALGENVNLASRLEGLNKFVGTDCLISGETRAAIGDRLVTRRLGLFTLKGFDKSVEVFEIVGHPDTAEPTSKWHEAFAEALSAYEGGHFELAAMAFRGVLDLKPEDGPTKFYLERLDDLSKEPLEGDWTGVTMLREK